MRNGVIGVLGDAPSRAKSDFARDERFAREAADQVWVQDIYKRMKRYTSQDLVDDIALQLSGVDRIVFTEHPTLSKVYVEEKFQSEHYDALPLEYVSDRYSKPRTPGFMEKSDQLTHLITFITVPTREYMIWNWRLLYAAWQANKEDWKSTYGGDDDPRNNTGFTSSLCCYVPIEVVRGIVPPLSEHLLLPEEIKNYRDAKEQASKERMRKAWELFQAGSL
jgi:hypothetical protein